MPAATPLQAKVDLLQSLNTSTINEDVAEFGTPALFVDYQGMERDGGITNQYIDAYDGDSACGLPIPAVTYDTGPGSLPNMVAGIRRRFSFPDNTVDVIGIVAANSNSAAYARLYRIPSGNLWTESLYANGAAMPNTAAFFCSSIVDANYNLDNPAIVRPDTLYSNTGITAVCGVNATTSKLYVVNATTTLNAPIDPRVFTAEARTTQTQGFGKFVGIPGVNLGYWHSLDPELDTYNFSSYARITANTTQYYPGVGYMAPASLASVPTNSYSAYCTPYHVNSTLRAIGTVANKCVGVADGDTGIYYADPTVANMTFGEALTVRTQLSSFNYFEGSFLVNANGTNANVHIFADTGELGEIHTFGINADQTAWTYTDITAPTIDPEADYLIASGALVRGFDTIQPTESAIINARLVFIQDQIATISVNSVPITAPGEIDPTYFPMYQPNFTATGGSITWKGIDGRFYAAEIGIPAPGGDIVDGVLPTYQKLSDNLYKYNTLQPVSIIDVKLNRAYVGPTDWNNRFIIYAPYIAAATRESAYYTAAVSDEHASGYWVGEKQIKNCADTGVIVMPYRSLYQVAGQVLQYRDASVVAATTYGYPVRVYKALKYVHSVDCVVASETVKNSIVGFTEPVSTYRYITMKYVDQLFEGTDYNASSIQNFQQVPMVAGCIYNPRVAYDGARRTTYVRSDAYDSYIAGNEVLGYYDTFDLAGTLYGFDGELVQQLILGNDGAVQSLRPAATAPGLQLIGKAPTLVWFLSAYDNSLYTFDGGRELTKKIRLNRMSAVHSGVWSTRENSLVLDTETDILFIRDGVTSSQSKSAIGENGAWQLIDTVNGVHLRDPLDTVSVLKDGFRFLYTPTATSVLLPLIIQTAYFGFDKNTRAMVQNAVITVMTDNPTTETMIIAAVAESFDQDNHYADSELITIVPYSDTAPIGESAAMWNSSGYARFRVTPSRQRSLGTSLAFAIPFKVRLLDITWNFTQDSQATIQNSR